MGDLGIDTAVERVGDGHYRARLRKEWEIWGPMGGYVASVAFRAAAAESKFARPASFACHYLAVGAFDTVDLRVTELRATRVAGSYRVEMTQGDRRILEATVWAIGDDVDGLEHDDGVPPDVEGPDGLPTIGELLADVDDPGPPFPFWDNFEVRPLQFESDWPPPEPRPPVFREWLRFLEGDFRDPWVDACRALVQAAGDDRAEPRPLRRLPPPARHRLVAGGRSRAGGGGRPARVDGPLVVRRPPPRRVRRRSGPMPPRPHVRAASSAFRTAPDRRSTCSSGTRLARRSSASVRPRTRT